MKTPLFLGLSACLAIACAAPIEGADEASSELASELVASPPFYGDPANRAVFGVDISMWEGPMAQAEMDCFWGSGVRHVVVGTQVEAVTRQQLAMSVSRGMSVDAYVYLNWYDDLRGQVAEAFRRVEGFPIGRMWLDVEDDNLNGLGWKTRVERIREGLDECKKHPGVECGIYTGWGYWNTHMNNTPDLSDVPLWYARYNQTRLLSAWPADSFGGWKQEKVVAKQWAEEVLCKVGVDKDTIQVRTPAAVTVDRTLPPDSGAPPPAPTGLYPADGAVIALDQVKLMTGLIPRATRYELRLEAWDGRAWRLYNTWSSADAFKATYPPKNAVYRFQARAMNARGWGPWSPAAVFDYGKVTGPRPDAAPPAPPAPTSTTPPAPTSTTPPAPTSTTPPAPPPPPSVPGAPTGLSPSGATITASIVALSWTPVTAAPSYEVAIETASGSTFAPYYTYTTASPSKAFSPTLRPREHRFHVRANVGGAWGPWSGYATFMVR